MNIDSAIDLHYIWLSDSAETYHAWRETTTTASAWPTISCPDAEPVYEDGWKEMMESPKQVSNYRKKKHSRDRSLCVCCRKRVPFCWTCRCGFQICQACMLQNFWGMSCNGITWQCPDCGVQNGLGNQ